MVYNFKRDRSIDDIPHAKHIELDEIPVKPGVYIVHPTPDQKGEVEAQMWEIWNRENIGVFIDESYMMDRYSPAYGALLTQGRSKRIPMINLSQRPAWVHPFMLSESDFYAVFRLQHKRDRKTVQEFIPHNLEGRLPEFYSHYYDVGHNKYTPLRPVPSIEHIYATFDRRLSRVRKTI